MYEEHSYQNDPNINMTDRLIDYINGGKQRPIPINDELMEDYKKKYFYYYNHLQVAPAMSTANSELNADKKLSQLSPVVATASSVINDDPSVKEPKPKFDKAKDAKPTTGEKGEVALQNEKSHRDTIKSVFGYSHDARIPSGNTGQLKSRARRRPPET